jgi:predicted ATPase/class 3 adenylate cyclase
MSPGRGLPTGTLTFLFTDIEGSTRLLQELGEGYRRVQNDHAEIMRKAIAEGEGVEIRTEGDSFFAVFTTPSGAVRAAVAAQRGLAAHEWPHGQPLRVRMGMHTGEAVLGGDDYLGIDVNRAARIAAAGHGGQVLLSDATRGLVEQTLSEGVRLRDLGARRLKDLALPMRIYQLDIDGLIDEFPELTTLDARPTNLPIQLTTFVGREREIERIAPLLGEHRLVTLTGAGGSGKTRLALQVAGEQLGSFHDGAFFVDLSAIRDPALVPSSLVQALGLAVAPGGDSLAAARAHLRERELLLILDNFEQVAAGASVIEDLLASTTRLRMLVTSRMVLRVYGEQEFEVPPFDVPEPERGTEELSRSDGVLLFVDRARAVKPDFELTDATASAIAAIVAKLDGLPLAIELAASRVRVLTPKAILSRLDQRLSLRAGSARGRPERQQTLRAAIEWSYDLLTEHERRVFARLSVFPGGCSIEAAEAVGGPEDARVAALDAVEALVEQSLVRQVEATEGDPRFRMLETISEYGGERLREEFDADATYRRLAEFLLGFVEEAEPHLLMKEQAVWLDRCEQERPNLRAAIRWALQTGEADIGLRTVTALWRFWHQRGPLWEGRQALDELLALGGSPEIRARALSAAGGMAWWSGDSSAAQRYQEEALPLFRQIGDQRGEMECLQSLATAMTFGAGGPVEERLRESLAIAEELGDRNGAAFANLGMGRLIALAQGDPATAIPIMEQALRAFDELGNLQGLAECLVSIAHASRRLGEPGRARSNYLRVMDMQAVAGNRAAVTGMLFFLSSVEGELGRHERAARLWAAADSAREITGHLTPPAAQGMIGDPVAAAREAMGQEMVERALAAGRAMDHDAALAFAHETGPTEGPET